MDQRLEKALKFAEYRTTLNNQLAQLQHRAETELLYSVNGGTFVINQTLIAFVDVILRSEQEEVIRLDKNDTPILISDIPTFFETILTRYNEVTKDLYQEVSRIRTARKVESVLDIDLGE